MPIINNDEAKEIPFREGYRVHIDKERTLPRVCRPVGDLGMAINGTAPDTYDWVGGFICVVGVAVIMYAPRSG